MGAGLSAHVTIIKPAQRHKYNTKQQQIKQKNTNETQKQQITIILFDNYYCYDHHYNQHHYHNQ